MRKTFTLIAFVALMLTAIPAQAQLKFGVKGGLNITNMSFSKDVVSSSNRTGFFIGPTVKFSLPLTGLGIDASALYDQREAKVKDEDGLVEKNIKQQAINIPINLRYGVGLGSLASVYFAAGPQFGFNVGDKNIDEIDWKWKSSVFSVNLGAGVTLIKHVQVGFNYNIVCGKSGEASVGNVAKSVVRGRSNAWQVSAAYYF